MVTFTDAAFRGRARGVTDHARRGRRRFDPRHGHTPHVGCDRKLLDGPHRHVVTGIEADVGIVPPTARIELGRLGIGVEGRRRTGVEDRRPQRAWRVGRQASGNRRIDVFIRPCGAPTKQHVPLPRNHQRGNPVIALIEVVGRAEAVNSRPSCAGEGDPSRFCTSTKRSPFRVFRLAVFVPEGTHHHPRPVLSTPTRSATQSLPCLRGTEWEYPFARNIRPV